MKRIFALLLGLSLALSGCGSGAADTALPETTAAAAKTNETAAEAATEGEALPAGTQIFLSDEGITVDGEPVSGSYRQSVYVCNDIVYYDAGQDFTYGEGTAADAHTPEEAMGHDALRITQPGTYILSGKLSAGQIWVNLGEDAVQDPDAVVTLVLNGVDITCTVAPAIVFYNVYECGDADSSGEAVDTSAAGANIIIADGTENTLRGSYVAAIYDPDTVVLSEDGTAVEEAQAFHEYDGAVYSKMSMNIAGNDGILNIYGENEGLGTDMHLTVNGGNLNIVSGNDGINTNRDGVSVTTINGGRLNITVSGETGEGDGIDSNGYLVVNGGTVVAAACGISEDAGIDADLGIYLNGGTVIATGNMYDRLSGGDQNYAVFHFAQTQPGGSTYTLKNKDGNPVISTTPVNDFRYLILAGQGLTAGDYSFWRGGEALEATAGQDMNAMMPGQGMSVPEGGEPPEKPEGMEMPPEGEMPEGMTPPEPMERPEGEIPPGNPERPGETIPPEEMELPGQQMEPLDQFRSFTAEPSEIFTITPGENFFSNVTPAG